MQEWVWRSLRFELPDEWEMLQFSREHAAGRCAFADRYQYRFELDWREVPAEPDMGRMMSDYRAELVAEGALAEPQLTVEAPWSGLVGRQGKALISRFGRFLAGPSCLVEFVFLWPCDRDERIERAVLASLEHAVQRWRAFGMRLGVPVDMLLTECRVEPANAVMHFAPAYGGEACRFGRLGMVRQWLMEPVDRWLRKQLPREVRDVACSTEHVDGHVVERTSGIHVPKALVKRNRAYFSAAWMCERDGRLYFAERIVGNGQGSKTEPVTLSCCGACEVRL